MINIMTSIYPYRMDLSSKKPIELSVSIKNLSKFIKLLSFDIQLDGTLSFEKSGLKKSKYFRLDDVKPNEIKNFKFQVHPSQGCKPGMHKIKLVVNEHYRDYNSLTDKTEKILQIKVI